MRCQGYEQHSETGMIRRCSLEDGHEGRHKHEPLPNSCKPQEDKTEEIEEAYNEFLKLDAYREFRGERVK